MDSLYLKVKKNGKGLKGETLFILGSIAAREISEGRRMKSKIIKPLGLQLEKCLKHLDQFEPKVEARIWKNVNGSSLTKIKTYLSKVEAQITDSSSNSSDSESSSSDEVPVLKKKKEKKGKSQEETNLEESRALAQRLQEEEN